MKTPSVLVFALLCAGCETSRQSPRLTVEQAMTASVQLANAKSDALYQKHPFQAGHLPQFAEGRWVWTDIRGVGLEDLQARVELAADGSTNRVDIKVLDSQNRQALRMIVPQP